MNVLNEVMLTVSGSLAASIVTKATLVLVLALIGSWLTRRSRAAVRHMLLTAAFSVLLVLPIASMISPPVRIRVGTVNHEQAAPLSFGGAIPSVAPSGGSTGIKLEIPQPSVFSMSAILLTVWITGMALFLLPMLVGLWRLRSLRRSAIAWRDGQRTVEQLAVDAGVYRRVEVLLDESLSGPMTCGVVHPAILLPPEAQTWNEEDLNRAIIHELEHVRRADWMWHCLARITCSVYWFHPLVWIAWRHLGLEAERACDDAVLSHSEATAYADQLIGLAQRLSKSPALAMANRSDLSARVGAVLNSRQQRGRAGAILVAFACVVAAVVVIAVSPLMIVAAPQSASAQPVANAPAFEVASVKLNTSDFGRMTVHLSPDTMTLRMIPFWECLRLAYGVEDFRISGQDWMQGRPFYDIVAKAPGSVPVTQLRLMLQPLLAERFHLKVHWEKREMAVQALLVAKGGPKFHESAPATGEPDPGADQRMQIFAFDSGVHLQISRDNPTGPFRYSLANAPLTALAGALMMGMSKTPIDTDAPHMVDMTGMQGRYDLVYHSPSYSPGDDSHDQVADYKTILQDELGLTLESRKAMVDVLVVDHADKTPTEN